MKAGRRPDFGDRPEFNRPSHTPSYRLHKLSGQAVVTLNGRDFYLGKIGSPESQGEFDRLMAEQLTNGRRLPDPASGVGSDPSVNEMLLAHEAPARRPRTTDSDHPFPRYPNLVEGLEVSRPDQVWVANITYVRLRKEFVYLAMLMDVFTRSIRGWHLGRSLSATHPRVFD